MVMPRGLSHEAVSQQSELCVWSESDPRTGQQQNCAICHEDYGNNPPEICRILDCGHIYHAKCIDVWLIKATFCPLCKADLKKYNNSSSQRSLGSGSGHSSSYTSLRSGQILVGHSNSDPVLLRFFQARGEQSNASNHVPPRGTPPSTPERHHSATSLTVSRSDRSLPGLGTSRSEVSIGILSSSSSGALPAVQEVSDEVRDGSQQSHSSNHSSTRTPRASPRSLETRSVEALSAGSGTIGNLSPGSVPALQQFSHVANQISASDTSLLTIRNMSASLSGLDSSPNPGQGSAEISNSVPVINPPVERTPSIPISVSASGPGAWSPNVLTPIPVVNPPSSNSDLRANSKEHSSTPLISPPSSQWVTSHLTPARPQSLGGEHQQLRNGASTPQPGGPGNQQVQHNSSPRTGASTPGTAPPPSRTGTHHAGTPPLPPGTVSTTYTVRRTCATPPCPPGALSRPGGYHLGSFNPGSRDFARTTIAGGSRPLQQSYSQTQQSRSMLPVMLSHTSLPGSG